jgi:hypothetical protein
MSQNERSEQFRCSRRNNVTTKLTTQEKKYPEKHTMKMVVLELTIVYLTRVTSIAIMIELLYSVRLVQCDPSQVKRFLNTLPFVGVFRPRRQPVVGRDTTYCLPLHYMFGLSTGLFPSSSNFR